MTVFYKIRYSFRLVKSGTNEVSTYTKNVEREKDFKKILSAENVDTYFKIAKILVNQLNWIIEFDCFKNMRYRLRIPMVHTVNEAMIDDDGEMEEEEVKDD